MQRLALAIMLGLTVLPAAHGQGRVPPPPPEPTPVVVPAAPLAPPIPVPPPPAPSPVVPPPTPGSNLAPIVPPPPPPETGPVLFVPAVEPCKSGWLVDVEVGLMFPHLDSFTDLPTVDPDAAVAGVVRFGYRLAHGGAVRLAFAGLDTNGTGDSWDSILGPVRVRSHIDNFYFDVDYVSSTLGTPESWSAIWNIGIRFVDQKLETSLTGPFGGVLNAANEFQGGGFHAGLELTHGLGGGGFALYGRADGGIVFGRGKQPISASTDFVTFGIETDGPEQVPMVNVQLGVRWLPTNCDWFRFVAGYQYERWWMQTRGDNADDAFFTRLGFDAHGPFLRFELGY